VSNVPAVLLLKPFVAALKDHDTAWLALAMASILAGNFTVLGSIANLIVSSGRLRPESRSASGIISGSAQPYTLITLVIGTSWLSL
jgi:Na+/H+ antiporter NhaD/arsenite permease-like protein